MALTKQQLYNLRDSNIYPNNNKEIDAVMLAEFQDNFINSIWAYVDTRRLVDLYDIRTPETLIDNTIYGLRWNAVQEDWSFAIGGGTGIQEGTEDGQTTVWDNDISAWLSSDLLKILEGRATLNTNLTVVGGGTTEKFVSLNPYDDVDFGDYNQYKANFHTHTRLSDGTTEPHLRIDSYEAEDYDILALTDHDTMHYGKWNYTLWEWEDIDDIYDEIKDLTGFFWGESWEDASTEPWQARYPLNSSSPTTQMIAVEGTEVSSPRHLGSHFCDFAGETSSNYDYIFEQIGDRGGLAQFYHAGRYTDDDPNELVDWYAGWYLKYPDTLIGYEVFNALDRYPTDREHYDNVLQKTLPGKPIWMFGNDDNHLNNKNWDFCVSWNVFLLDTLDEANVKNAYKEGEFYVCNKTAEFAPDPPVITDINISAGRYITITATGYDEIRWIADGEVVLEDENTIDVHSFGSAKYVRAELIAISGNDEGRTLTQPFILTDTESPIEIKDNVYFENPVGINTRPDNNYSLKVAGDVLFEDVITLAGGIDIDTLTLDELIIEGSVWRTFYLGEGFHNDKWLILIAKYDEGYRQVHGTITGSRGDSSQNSGGQIQVSCSHGTGAASADRNSMSIITQLQQVDDTELVIAEYNGDEYFAIYFDVSTFRSWGAEIYFSGYITHPDEMKVVTDTQVTYITPYDGGNSMPISIKGTSLEVDSLTFENDIDVGGFVYARNFRTNLGESLYIYDHNNDQAVQINFEGVRVSEKLFARGLQTSSGESFYLYDSNDDTRVRLNHIGLSVYHKLVVGNTSPSTAPDAQLYVSDNVHIGTTSGTRKFEVRESLNSSGTVEVAMIRGGWSNFVTGLKLTSQFSESIGNRNFFIDAVDGTDTNRNLILQGDGGSVGIQKIPNTDYALDVDGTINADNILISDNLGVGTDEPNRPIHIQGDGDTYMSVDSSTEDNISGYLMGVNGTWEGIMRYNDEHKFLGIGVRDHTDTLVTAGGNVAIGTTDPGGARLRIMMSNGGHIRFNNYGVSSARMDVTGTFYLNYTGGNFRIASDGSHHSEFNSSGDLYVLKGDVHADDFITNSKVASKEENALSKLDNIDEWLDSDNNIQYEKHYAYKETVASDDDNKDRVRKGLSMETRVAMLEKMVYELSTELKKYR